MLRALRERIALAPAALLRRVAATTVRERFALTVALLQAGLAVWYCYQIYTCAIEPVLATWIVFFVATMLGLWTYLRSQKNGADGLVTNAANATDVFVVSAILLAILLFGSNVRLRFTQLDLASLAAAGCIGGYYLLRRDAFTSNIAVNVLMTLGFIPTFARLMAAQRNTESFSFWTFVLCVCAISLYNPIRARDLLAIVYPARAFVMVSIVLILMVRVALK
jgi:hypothetical protein